MYQRGDLGAPKDPKGLWQFEAVKWAASCTWRGESIRIHQAIYIEFSHDIGGSVHSLMSYQIVTLAFKIMEELIQQWVIISYLDGFPVIADHHPI